MLPGLALMIGAMKLASAQIVSGSSGLIYGVARHNWVCLSSESGWAGTSEVDSHATAAAATAAAPATRYADDQRSKC
jgi:hypothetical protein